MKKFLKISLMVFVLALLSQFVVFGQDVAVEAVASRAAELAKPRIVFAEGSKLWLEGKSTLHDFEIEAGKVLVESEITLKDGDAAGSPDLVKMSDKAPRLSRLVVTVPIDDMNCHIAGLAGQMKKTLKAKDHPEIIFEMKDYSITKIAATEEQVPSEPRPDEVQINAQGLLSMAGVTNAVELIMTAEIVDGVLHVKGEKDVLMTSHDIKVPVMFFGKIKTEDKVEVSWDLNISVTTEAEKKE